MARQIRRALRILRVRPLEDPNWAHCISLSGFIKIFKVHILRSFQRFQWSNSDPARPTVRQSLFGLTSGGAGCYWRRLMVGLIGIAQVVAKTGEEREATIMSASIFVADNHVDDLFEDSKIWLEENKRAHGSVVHPSALGCLYVLGLSVCSWSWEL